VCVIVYKLLLSNVVCICNIYVHSIQTQVKRTKQVTDKPIVGWVY